MDAASDRSVYNGAANDTPSESTRKSPCQVHPKCPTLKGPYLTTLSFSETSHKSSSGSAAARIKKSLSRNAVASYMSTKNEGGDPVTALSLRPDSPTKSSANRRAKVGKEVEAALKKLNGSS
ncbi:hypothetical protein PG997_001721 [Apiospora hydei]|uniref:Uncharacterized protein n=1 Tax=Apiospora hydei TaxID=1337664 RepID=A0ABR1XEC6_9PEZI